MIGEIGCVKSQRRLVSIAEVDAPLEGARLARRSESQDSKV
jgi:hypothetical protein